MTHKLVINSTIDYFAMKMIGIGGFRKETPRENDKGVEGKKEKNWNI